MNERASEPAKVEATVIDYLTRVNPSVMERAPDPTAVKLRRVLDSLDMMEFITYLEQTYRFKIGDRDVLSKNFETVTSVVTFLESRVSDA